MVSNMLELMRAHHQGYTTEILWIQAYRVMFLMVEALLFAGAFGLIQIYVFGPASSYWIKFLFYLVIALGIIVIIFWILVCVLRSRRAEEWRDEIDKIYKDNAGSLSSEEQQFYKQCKLKPVAKLGKCIFNLVIPILLVPVWAAILISGIVVI